MPEKYENPIRINGKGVISCALCPRTWDGGKWAHNRARWHLTLHHGFHACKICGKLTAPGGHALCIGEAS